MKKHWLELHDIIGDVAMINLEHVDYIRIDYVLRKAKIKFESEEHECEFDFINSKALEEAFYWQKV